MLLMIISAWIFGVDGLIATTKLTYPLLTSSTRLVLITESLTQTATKINSTRNDPVWTIFAYGIELCY